MNWEYQSVRTQHVYVSDPETKTKAICPNIWTGTAKPYSFHGKDSEGVCKHSS